MPVMAGVADATVQSLIGYVPVRPSGRLPLNWVFPHPNILLLVPRNRGPPDTNALYESAIYYYACHEHAKRDTDDPASKR
jgi:hypothetical protein